MIIAVFIIYLWRGSKLENYLNRILKLKKISGQKNGMEEWSVPLFSSLEPDEFQSISSDVSSNVLN